MAAFLTAREGVDAAPVCARSSGIGGYLAIAAGALDAWLSERDLRADAAALAPKPLIPLHAEGGERVPYIWSQQLGAPLPGPAGCRCSPAATTVRSNTTRSCTATALARLTRALD